MTAQAPTEIAEHLIQTARTANEKKKLYLEQHKITKVDIPGDNFAAHKDELTSIKQPVLDAVNELTPEQTRQIYAMAIFGRRLRAGGTGSLKQELDDINYEVGQDHLKCLEHLTELASNLDLYLQLCLDFCKRKSIDPNEELR